MLLAKEQGAIIVCTNPDIYKTKAERYGIIGIDFVSYRDYLFELSRGSANKYRGRNVFIDELEIFLESLDSHIKGYSLSED
jgi:hypothetical protein